MSICTSADIALFTSSSNSLEACVDGLSGGSEETIPQVADIKACMTTDGITADCGQCIGSLIMDLADCAVACITSDGASGIPKACSDCASALDRAYNKNGLICGISPSDPAGTGNVGVAYAKQLQELTSGANSSSSSVAGPSIMTVTKTIIVLAVLILGQ